MSINTTFSIFQNGGRPPSWICKSSKFQLLVRFECVDLRPILVDVNGIWLLCVTVLNSDEVLFRGLGAITWRAPEREPITGGLFK